MRAKSFFSFTDHLSLLLAVCTQGKILPFYILLPVFFFSFFFSLLCVSFPCRRVSGEFAQLRANELVLGQRLPGRQQRLPQQPEHGQGRAEDPALLPRRLHRHPGEERQGRGPGFSTGTANCCVLYGTISLVRDSKNCKRTEKFARPPRGPSLYRIQADLLLTLFKACDWWSAAIASVYVKEQEVFFQKKTGGKQKRARFKQMQAEVLSQLESIRLLVESSGISTWPITGRLAKWITQI